MIRRKSRLLAVFMMGALISSMLTLAGCWDLRYLDKLGVVMALGIDEDPSGQHLLQVTAQVVLTQNASADTKVVSSGPPVTIFTETGDTLFEAIRKMSSKTSRRLFFSHTQMLIISEGIAKKGIYPLLDLIERNPDIRGDISVAIIQSASAKDLLDMTMQLESIPANQLYQSILVNEFSYGSNHHVTVQDIIRVAGMGKEQVAVPAIRIIGNKENKSKEDNITPIQPESYPTVASMAVFRKGKLAGYLTPTESRGYGWLKNKIVSTVVKLQCPNEKRNLMVEIQKSISAVKSKIDDKGMPVIKVRIDIMASIREVMCSSLSVTDEAVLKQISDQTSKAIEEEIEATVRTLQKRLKSDVLGWGTLIYRERPSLWKKINQEWPNLFSNIEYEIVCKTIIKGAGVRDDAVLE